MSWNSPSATTFARERHVPHHVGTRPIRARGIAWSASWLATAALGLWAAFLLVLDLGSFGDYADLPDVVDSAILLVLYGAASALSRGGAPAWPPMPPGVAELDTGGFERRTSSPTASTQTHAPLARAVVGASVDEAESVDILPIRDRKSVV